MNSEPLESHPLEIADVVRRHGAELIEKFGSVLSSEQRRVLRDIACCRTAALGGHVSECDECGHRQAAYNSCRNRHCPKCQAAARAEWLEDRASELLPVPYFHVVFTLPESIAALALHNQRVVYGLLFQAASATLLEVAANPQHLGARIGVLAVLHTWGQNLMYHPHLHCVVPGGGFSDDGKDWVSCRPNFFLPVRVLSRVFRGKFIDLLRRARTRGKLKFLGAQSRLGNDAAFEAWLDQTVRTEWVVYAKPPFGGPEQVLKYLARYTHRVAISNQRLIKLENGQVTFRWKDYADGNTKKTMALSAVEFLRRFLLHVLPKGFVKIRHFGFMANRHRKSLLEHARKLLGVDCESVATSDAVAAELPSPTLEAEISRCPACGQGRLHCIEELPRFNLFLPLPVLFKTITVSRPIASRRIDQGGELQVVSSPGSVKATTTDTS